MQTYKWLMTMSQEGIRSRKELLQGTLKYIELIRATLGNNDRLLAAVNGAEALKQNEENKNMVLSEDNKSAYFSTDGGLQPDYYLDDRKTETFQKFGLDNNVLTEFDSLIIYGLFHTLRGTLWEEEQPAITDDLEALNVRLMEWHGKKDFYTETVPKELGKRLNSFTSLADFQKQLPLIQEQIKTELAELDHSISIAESKTPKILENRENLKKEPKIKGSIQIVKDMVRNLRIVSSPPERTKHQVLTNDETKLTEDISKILGIETKLAEELISAQSQECYYAANTCVHFSTAINTQLTPLGIFVKWEDNPVWQIKNEGGRVTQTITSSNLMFEDTYNNHKILTIECELQFTLSFDSETRRWKLDDLVQFKGGDKAKQLLTSLLNDDTFDFNQHPILDKLSAYELNRVNPPAKDSFLPKVLQFYLYDRQEFKRRLGKHLSPKEVDNIMESLSGLEGQFSSNKSHLSELITAIANKELTPLLQSHPEIESFLIQHGEEFRLLAEHSEKLLPENLKAAITNLNTKAIEVFLLNELPEMAQDDYKKYLSFIEINNLYSTEPRIRAGIIFDSLMHSESLQDWKIEALRNQWRQANPEMGALDDKKVDSLIKDLHSFYKILANNPLELKAMEAHLLALHDATYNYQTAAGLINHLQIIVDHLPKHTQAVFVKQYEELIKYNRYMKMALQEAKLSEDNPLYTLVSKEPIYVMLDVSSIKNIEQEQENQKELLSAIRRLRAQADKPNVTQGDQQIIKSLADDLEKRSMEYFDSSDHSDAALERFKKETGNMINEVASYKLSHNGKNFFSNLLRAVFQAISNVISVGDLDKTKEATEKISDIRNTVKFLHFKQSAQDLKPEEEGLEQGDKFLPH